VRIDICDYYGEVQDFDTQLGRVIEILEDVGELDNTLLIVTSDNGMPFPRCKANLYDLGTHVPLAIRWKGLSRTGVRSDTFVSLCDLAPSILDAAGIRLPVPMSGQSLVPILTGGSLDPAGAVHRPWAVTGRERHIAAQKDSRNGYPMRAIRTADHLYVRNFAPGRWPAGSPPQYRDVDRSPTKRAFLEKAETPEVAPLFELAFGRRPAEELYDLRTDPWQVNNLAYDPAHRDTRDRLWAQLSLELMRTNDPRVIGDGSQFDRYPYYMLKRIYQ
jgi:arylsulfatase A-like enzyme